MGTTAGRRELVGARSGFTLLELIVVLLVGSVALGVTVVAFRGFQESTTARRAAEVFVQDLATARGAAMRQRAPVAIAFDEAGRVYRVRSGEQLFVTRDFSGSGEIALSGVTISLPGDSVLFNGRGFADLSEAGGPVATASFQAGSRMYQVDFNALAATEVRSVE